MNKIFRVGIAGYGIVGKRRHHFIKENPNLKVVSVCDKTFNEDKIVNNNISFYKDFNKLLNENLDILFVCLTNDVAAEVTIKGLEKGFHVFCEKPPGRNVQDILNVIETEKKNPNLKLKYGFNHRYHDSIELALKKINEGSLGEIINLKGTYGKSRIIPFDGGWRSEREIAGGGILLDQGIHMVDLMRLFNGKFIDIKSFISNSYWNHDVEDNAYALMKDEKGRIAVLHSSATQWTHKFSLEITMTEGYIELHGILSGSKSYGEEQLVIGTRDDDNINGQMKYERIKFLNDNSWKKEIDEFTDCIINDNNILNGNSNDALETMELVYKIYHNDIDWRNKFNIKI